MSNICTRTAKCSFEIFINDIILIDDYYYINRIENREYFNGVGATETKVVSANGRAQWQVAGDAVGRESDDRVQRVHVGLFLSFAHLHRSENASRAGATPASAAPRTRLKRGVRRLQLSHYLAPAPVSFIGISICIYIYTYTHTYTYIYTRIHRHT